jgi:hypothetical protein
MPKTKSGEQITWKEWFSRAGKGIKQVATNPTPLERVSIESRATFINLTGLIICLTAIIIFRDKFFVNWFAYGLILIFIGGIITTGLKYLGLREQKKFLKGFNKPDNFNIDKLMEELNENIEKTSDDYDKENILEDNQRKKDKSDSPNENYLETQNKTEEENKSGQMSVDVDTHADKNIKDEQGVIK